MSRQRMSLFLACFLFLESFTLAVLPSIAAQSEPGFWSQPLKLFEGQGSISEPVVVADLSGMVHVFWVYSEPPELEQIYYTRWNGTAWAEPVDIVASPQARGPSVAVDRDGWVHLVWHGTANRLLYSRAHIASATSAQGWTEPVAIAEGLLHSHVVADPAGVLHVTFGGTEVPGVYYQISEDGGASWSRPRQIAKTSRADVAADNVRIAIGTNDFLHVVWTEHQLPTGWPILGVFYTRSTDGGRSWSDPLDLAGSGFNEINVAAIGEDDVHVAWNGIAGVGGRYDRWSFDGGVTWSDTSTVVSPGLGGSEGPPQLVGDAAGVVHLLTTYSYEEERCPWYSSWDGVAWTEPVCIAPDEARPSNYVEDPAMTLGNGNRLHAVYWDGPQRLWYITKQTLAPSMPSLPLPTEPNSSLRVTSVPTEVSSSPTPAPASTVPFEGSIAANMSSGSMWPAILGILAATTLVTGVVLVRILRVGRS